MQYIETSPDKDEVAEIFCALREMCRDSSSHLRLLLKDLVTLIFKCWVLEERNLLFLKSFSILGQTPVRFKPTTSQSEHSTNQTITL